MVEESNSSSAGKMEINDIGVKKEISFVAEVSCVKEKMSSEVSSEGNDSSKNTNEIVPRLKTEESEDCPNDCVPPFCFVGIKTEEPVGYESGESCASSGKVPSGGESPNNVERECSDGLNEKSGVELSNHPTCVDIKTESDEDVDTNSRPDSTSSVHRCDMGHSSNEFIRGIECRDFPILCIKQEEENTKEQSAGNANNSGYTNESSRETTVQEKDLIFRDEMRSSPCGVVLGSEMKHDQIPPHFRNKFNCDCDDGGENVISESVPRASTRRKIYSCYVCEASFFLANALTKHMETTHTGSRKSFTCDVCGDAFGHKLSLKEHERTHKGEKRFPCSVCDASFKRRDHLEKHVRTHSGEKPFSCGECESSFSQSHHLKLHMQTHTGMKPFECATCNASFCRKGQLRLHVLNHTGEKPFACGSCGASFSRKYSLEVHMRTHTGEKPFRCGTCGASFGHKNSLTAHVRTHTGEKPFACGVCKASFTQSGHLKRHKLIHV